MVYLLVNHCGIFIVSLSKKYNNNCVISLNVHPKILTLNEKDIGLTMKEPQIKVIAQTFNARLERKKRPLMD